MVWTVRDNGLNSLKEMNTKKTFTLVERMVWMYQKKNQIHEGNIIHRKEWFGYLHKITYSKIWIIIRENELIHRGYS